MSEFEIAKLRAKALQEQLRARAAEKPKTFGQRVKENLLGDNDPTTQNLGERIGSTLNKAGEAMTFGLIGDEASAAVESLAPGVSYDERLQHYRDQEALLRKNNPGLSLGAEVGGALAGAVAAPMAAPSAGLGLIGRMGTSAAMTGAGAGTYAFMEGEGGDRTENALNAAKLGAGIGAAIPLAGAALQKLVDAVVMRRAVQVAAKGAPTTEALREAGQAAYKAIDNAGVQIKPEAFQRMLETAKQKALANGLDALPGPGSLTPNASRVLTIGDEMAKAMSKEPTAALPFSSLDQLRRHAGTAASNMANKTESRVGTGIIETIDDFVKTLDANDVTTGDVKTLQSTIGKARDLWSRMSRSQMIDDAIEAGGGNYMSGGASGVRNQFKRILNNKKLSRGFSDAEKALMRRVVSGSIPETILNYMGSGLGMMGSMGAGLGLGGVPGLLAGTAVAYGARRGSEALVNRNAEAVRSVIANGGLLTPSSPALPRAAFEGLLRGGTAAALQ